jgi:hypothetical protein
LVTAGVVREAVVSPTREPSWSGTSERRFVTSFTVSFRSSEPVDEVGSGRGGRGGRSWADAGADASTAVTMRAAKTKATARTARRCGRSDPRTDVFIDSPSRLSVVLTSENMVPTSYFVWPEPVSSGGITKVTKILPATLASQPVPSSR